MRTALNLWPHPIPAGVLREFRRSIRDGKYPDFTAAYQELLLTLEFARFDPDHPNDAVILANLGRFNALLTDYEAALRRGGSAANWVQDLKGLLWYLNTYAMGAYEEQAADDPQGVDAVQLSTVHQAKGLEWPVVFLPAIVSRRFPSSKAGQQKGWLVPRALFDAARIGNRSVAHDNNFAVFLSIGGSGGRLQDAFSRHPH